MSENGKIIKSIAGFYEVACGDTVYRCRAKGLFRALGEKPLVGDDVLFDITDTVSVPPEGNVVKLLERKNALIRPNVVNVDQALLVFAITDPLPSFNMLDRFLITMNQKNLPSILCFNKTDIAPEGAVEELKSVYENCGCQVLFISVRHGDEDLDRVRECLRGKTTVITGPSGVGKSSLINKLCPHANMETGELSRKIARGKNTTRHVELLRAEWADNTFLVDTPGFTSLYLLDLEAEDVKYHYPEFDEYAPYCRFQGCNHISEPDCRVKQALQEGSISRIRYRNYTEIFREIKERKPVY